MTRTARANHGNGFIIFLPNLSLYVQTRRRIGDGPQTGRIDFAAKGNDSHSRFAGTLHLPLNLVPLRESEQPIDNVSINAFYGGQFSGCRR
jgi:hypothetical protein